MMFVFFYLKSQNVNDMWLPKGDGEHPAIQPLSSSPAWTVTLIAALGMALHYFGLRSARSGNQSGLKGASLLAMLAAIVASVMQWNTIANAPFTFYEGTYVSAFYLLTIMNLVHLFLTVFISFGNWNRARMGLYKSNYWHVDIVNVWWVWMAVSSALGAFCLSMA
jgi:heme/copper-type cytochrome/quinol oxidase subunit 3